MTALEMNTARFRLHHHDRIAVIALVFGTQDATCDIGAGHIQRTEADNTSSTFGELDAQLHVNGTAQRGEHMLGAAFGSSVHASGSANIPRRSRSYSLIGSAVSDHANVVSTSRMQESTLSEPP